MRFVLVCGGSAGHINPALAIAGQLRRIMPDAKILFIGSGRALEKKLIPEAGYELKNIKMSGLKRGISPQNLLYNAKTVKNLVFAGGQATKILTGFKPDAVIGTGGYICYPVIKSAAKMKIPTMIHESNAIPGLTAKLLSSVADKTLVSFPDTEGLYRKPERVVLTGTPVREGFGGLSYESSRIKLKLDSRPLVVSFWGSQGAGYMNEYMVDFIKLNNEHGSFNHIHATGGGESGLKRMRERLRNLDVAENPRSGIDIRAYIDNMETVMTAADLILCRAGASTLAELTIMGKPAVLVPSPYVPNNHQEPNARALEKAGGAEVLVESECSGKRLYDLAVNLLGDKEKLKKMAKAQESMGTPNAAEKIAEEAISICV